MKNDDDFFPLPEKEHEMFPRLDDVEKHKGLSSIPDFEFTPSPPPAPQPAPPPEKEKS